MPRQPSHTPDSPATEPRHAPDHFELFELEIERGKVNYKARVTTSPIRKTRAVEVDLSHFDLENPFASVVEAKARGNGQRHARGAGFDVETLEDWGRALFKATFVGELRTVLENSLRQVRSEGNGLRLALRLDEVPELAQLPWETLGDAMSEGVFNGRLDFLVGRTLNVVKARKHRDKRPQKLRLLGLLPQPVGQDELSGADEWQKLEELLADHIQAGILDAHRVDPPTHQELGRQIDRGPCQILHVVAHGELGIAGKGGILNLEKSRGETDPIAGHQFIQALTSRELPRLVVLNSCYGAASSVVDAFDGLAQSLLKEGVSSVVAMRTGISDAAALTFAEHLYRQLALGRTIESAMAEARRALALLEDRSEWATPVLYSRGGNLEIFTPPPHRGGADGGVGQRMLRGLLVILLAGMLWLLWALVSASETDRDEPCTAPPGLEDLRFLEILPGVVDLGSRKVVVEEAFCMATKEVSRRDWLEVMGGELPRKDWPLDWPMTDVTRAEAESFAQQLGERDPGVVYRLPTAMEWEFAARAGSPTAYSFGDDKQVLHRYGNCRNLLAQDEYEGPAPVGSFIANPWGLYDMHGNVSEWVLADDPEQEGRYLRLGGSFKNVRENCSFDHRSWIRGTRDQDTGFRVVRKLQR